MKKFRDEHKQLAVNALAIIGFVAVLIAGIWGSVQVARVAPSALSSLAAVATSLTSVFTPAESITINTPTSTIPTDAVYTLSWEHSGKPEGGSYTLVYSCREGLSLQSPNRGGIYEEITCGTPFNFSNEDNKVLFIPLLEKGQFVDVVVKLSAFDKEGNQGTSSETTLTIAKGGAEVPTGAVAGSRPLTAGEETSGNYSLRETRAVSNPSGRPDLKVTILGLGTIGDGGVFTPGELLSATSSQGAVRFEIANAGDKTSDTWTFNAVLPTTPMHIFHSETQQALQPGDKIVFTLGFNQLDSEIHGGVVTINADPTGSMNESNEENNIAQITVE